LQIYFFGGCFVSKISINEIVVPQNRARGFNPDRIDELKDSIMAVGLLQPVVINSQNILIAGLHRLEACKALGWTEIDCIVKDLQELDAELAEIDENLVRNELTVLERAELLKRRKDIYEAKYPETKKGQYGYKGKSVIEKSENEIISFSEDTAKKIGTTPRTIQHEIQIAKGIDDDVKSIIKNTEIANSKKDLLSLARLEPEKQKQIAEKISELPPEKVTVRELREEIKKINQTEPISLPMPKNKYSVIYIDPPWPVGSIVMEKWQSPIEDKYPTMSLEEISNLPIPDLALDDCALFMWTTHTFLPDALEIIKKWGFKYHCLITWDKGNGWTQFGFNKRTEFLIYAYRGKMIIDQYGESIPTLISEPKTIHSKKPDSIREKIKIKTPEPRLEMFGRGKAPDGWEFWGLDAEIGDVEEVKAESEM